jgi:hypothetical protein
VQRSNLSHILNGRNKPGYDFLLKVVQAFPNVSTHWLITGEEAQSTNETQQEPQIRETEANNLSEEKPSLNNKKVIKTVIFYDDFTFDVQKRSLTIKKSAKSAVSA